MDQTRLIELIHAKEEQGMEQLLSSYGPLMPYIIAPILKDSRDREECLSEATMRIWERIDQYDPEKGSWTAWLTAVIRNAA